MNLFMSNSETESDLLKITLPEKNKDYRKAYLFLYSFVGKVPNHVINKVERNLVNKERKETGSDKIHWDVWNKVKDQEHIKKALGS